LVGESDDVEVESLDWDRENVTHIARHGVSRENVEFALSHAPRFFRNLPGRSATHIMMGRDEEGRVLYVPLIQLDRPGATWRVVSAWESRFARRLYPGEEQAR